MEWIPRQETEERRRKLSRRSCHRSNPRPFNHETGAQLPLSFIPSPVVVMVVTVAAVVTASAGVSCYVCISACIPGYEIIGNHIMIMMMMTRRARMSVLQQKAPGAFRRQTLHISSSSLGRESRLSRGRKCC